MNVVVSNRQKEIIDNANIDAIKDLNGLFNVDDLISKFKNYFFSKMILDATSVVNFATKDVLTKLANEIGADKLVVLLPSTPEPPAEFKQLLIDLKIYNFSNKIEDVVKYIENPNTYENAMDMLANSEEKSIYVDNSVKENDLNNISVIENNEEKKEEETEKINKEEKEDNKENNSSSLDNMLTNFNVELSGNEENTEENEEEKADDTEESQEDSSEESDEEDKSVLNLSSLMQNDAAEEKEPEESNEEKNEDTEETESTHSKFLFTDGFDSQQDELEEKDEKTVIGVVNVTLHAGSTTLIYMLKNAATNHLGKNALGIELNKNDFRLFRDKKMISIDEKDIESTIENSKENLIFVDLNDCSNTDFCTDVLYLVEPSIIKLNGLMANNKDAFKELKNKKVLLNKCLLSKNDIRDLASEAGIEFFDSIAPFNDRDECSVIYDLLENMNIK